MKNTRYKEIFLYLIFGILTTLVNFLSFLIFTYILGETLYLLSNFIAWFISVVFAYLTNKKFVFKSKKNKFEFLLKEIIYFFAARIFSFLFEEIGLYIFVDVLKFEKFSMTFQGFEITGQFTAKIILAIVVVILNFFFSKYIIFSKKNTN